MTRLKHGIKATRVKAGRSVAFKTSLIILVAGTVLVLVNMLCMYGALKSENIMLNNWVQDAKQETVIVKEIINE